MTLLRLTDVVKRYGTLRAVDELSLSVESGELVCLLGPSGCGKSTTLRTIAGFETPEEGTVELATDGELEDVTRQPPNEQGTSMVFQDWALFPSKSVIENVAFGPKMAGVDRERRRARARKMLELVEMTDHADGDPTDLSGGQKQRVALARSLAVDPDLLLLDEPLSNLDRRLRETMQLELKSIHERLDATMVYVTHDQDEAFTLADRIAVVDDGQIEQIGPPEEVYTDPDTLFVESFLGTSNFLACQVATTEGSRMTLDLPLDARLSASGGDAMSPGDHVTLSLRPEHLSVSPEMARADGAMQSREELAFTATVDSRLHRGSRYRYELTTGDTALVTSRRVADRLGVDPGDRVTVRCDVADINFFDDDGRRVR